MGTAFLHYVKEFGSDNLSVLAYGTSEGFHSTFSSVNAARNIEKLTYQQTVPSDATGGAVLWQHHKVKWDLLGGADADRIEGTDTDRLVPTGLSVGGGIQVEREFSVRGMSPSAASACSRAAARASSGTAISSAPAQVWPMAISGCGCADRCTACFAPHVERVIP